jgi:hypothetical protein
MVLETGTFSLSFRSSARTGRVSSPHYDFELREFAQKDVCNAIKSRDDNRAGSYFLGKHYGGRGGRTVGAGQANGRSRYRLRRNHGYAGQGDSRRTS